MKTSISRACVAAAAAWLLPALASCDAGAPVAPAPLVERSAGLTLDVPGGYATIAAALAAAQPGDEVVIAAGVFQESLSIPTGVSLRGAGVDKTFLHGGIQAYATGVSLADLTVDGTITPDAYAAIDVFQGQADIRRVHVKGGTRGIVVEANTGALTVDRVRVEGTTGAGIVLGAAKDVTVSNAIVATNQGHGLQVVSGTAGTANVLVTHSLLFANGFAAAEGAGYVTDSGGVTLANSIVTSNNRGVACSAACPVSSSVVWGNVLNYGGVAVADVSHIKKDPRFASPTEGDFTLRFDSPAIDAGAPAFGVDHDFTGLGRPKGAGFDLGPFEVNTGDAAITVAITEILANPLDESTGEYVELLNTGDAPVDVAGFVLDDGDATDLIVGWAGGPSVIPPHTWAVVLDPDYAGQYTIPAEAILLTVASTTTLGSGLSNSDPVRLLAADGATPVDAYSFPFDAGNGVSVEKDALEDGDALGNWVASPCGGTPGAANCASLPPNVSKQVHIAINEVMANPLDETTGEFVELYNFATDPIDVGGMVLSDGDSTDVITGWAGGLTVLAPGQIGVILDPDYAGQYTIPAEAVLLGITSTTTLGNGLSTNDPITLYEANGTVVIDTYTHTFDPGNGKSVEKVDFVIGDIGSNYVASTCASGSSPGAVNCVTADGAAPVSGPTIAITEVMANPLDEDRGEYVELFNYGTEPVDLLGWRFSDGDEEDTLQALDGGSAVLEPLALAVIVDAEYSGQYPIPAGVLLLTTDDTTLGSGLATTDPLKLRAPKGAKAVDTFLFPFNPGNGLSAEKIDLVVGDVPENWVVSPCNASPGKLNCAWGASGASETALSTAQITISEIMANPVDEGSGEYVELFNAGPVGVDLAGFHLSDGDSVDTIGSWKGGKTLLAPGQFALILDSDYVNGTYKIPTGALRLAVGDSTLGNGLSTSDPITLLEPDGLTVVAAFSFPTNPGNGRSIEKVALTAGDVQSNWTASPCALAAGDGNDGASPGAANCADKSGGLSGTGALGQSCPFGSADCLSGLCGIDLLTEATFCTVECTSSACPAGFSCQDTIDANYAKICLPVAGSVPQVVINEVLYDAVGADTDVFIELSGPPDAILDSLTLVGINGANGAEYVSIPLTGMIGPSGTFVIAHPSASAGILAKADMLTTKADLQNGPDSLQLRKGTTVLDAVGYGAFGTSAVFAGEGTPAPSTAAGQSLARTPSGTDTGDNGADFQISSTPTPGAPNL